MMGFISSLILIFLLFLIIKTMFFSSTFVSPNDLADFSNLCENNDFNSSINIISDFILEQANQKY